MTKKIMSGTCLILGIVLLIPDVLQLRGILETHFSKNDLLFLPEAQTDFVFSIFGQKVDSLTASIFMTTTGVLLLLAGFRMMKRKSNQ